MKYNIHFLPAKYGDCIIIEYGHTDTHYVLIDGGTGGTLDNIRTFFIDAGVNIVHFDLIVITHIDRDHIEGILKMLEPGAMSFTASDLWYNAWQHLDEKNELESFGAKQGEKLSSLILSHSIPWNLAFGNKAVVIEAGSLPPIITLPGGMKITLLSPNRQHLLNIKREWAKELAKANLIPGYGLRMDSKKETETTVEHFGAVSPDVEMLASIPYIKDDSPSNGSSIAFVASFGGKTALFSGDAFPEVLVDSLSLIDKGKIQVDLTKLSHHGGSKNTSPELIQKLDCSKFAISTNGSNYGHPAMETVARIIKSNPKGVELYFNYRTRFNGIWDSTFLKLKHNYTTIYPVGEGICIVLI